MRVRHCRRDSLVRLPVSVGWDATKLVQSTLWSALKKKKNLNSIKEQYYSVLMFQGNLDFVDCLIPTSISLEVPVILVCFGHLHLFGL